MLAAARRPRRRGHGLQGCFLLVACLPRLHQALEDQCKDPLFETHWFGKSDIQTLSSIPTVKTELRLCPQYNRMDSCCNEEFEIEQQRYFDNYKEIIFVSKLARVITHRQSIADVRNIRQYSEATHTELEQYHRVLAKFNPVLHPSIHGECFSAILVFVAGMNCFACRPDWFGFVTREHNVVVRVHVSSSDCMQVWSSCEAFGTAAHELKQALLDSVLAKQAQSQEESLDMFTDQQALCSWLHNEVALHPFQRPSMTEREAAPAADSAEAMDEEMLNSGPVSATPSAAQSTGTQERRLSKSFRKEMDVLHEGRLSGFDTRWGSASSVAMPQSLSRVVAACITLMCIF